MKQILSLLLCVSMVFLFAAASCRAEENISVSTANEGMNSVVQSGTCGDALVWEVDENSLLTISGTGAMKPYYYRTTDSEERSPWYYLRIKTAVIQEGVTSIGDYAFYACTSLTDITIPDSVTDIGHHAFGNCGGLTEITIPDSVTSIDVGAFSGCSDLTSINMPAGLTSIGQAAFYECSGLTSINMPAGLTSIGPYAFFGCIGLTELTIPAGVTDIGDRVFEGCSSLQQINVDSKNTKYISVNGILYNKSGTEVVTCPAGIEGSLTIPNGVTSIGSQAFYGCEGITDVTIPNGVTTIEGWAFYGCTGLTSITIPSSVTSIGGSVFEDCDSLTSIVYEGTATEWENLKATLGSSNSNWYDKVTCLISEDDVYTVSFDANGGTVDQTGITVTYGSTYGTLPVPACTGRTFAGWYTAAAGGTEVTSNTKVSITADQMLYAHWTNTISYDANGGTGGPSSQIKQYGIPLTLSSSKPDCAYRIWYEANGGSVSTQCKYVECTFVNWNSREDGTGTSYPSGGVYTANEDVTLYAQWTNPGAGTLSTPSRTGYEFSGWFTSRDGGEQIIASSTITETITVYAHWAAEIYTVEFNANGGTVSEKSKTVTYESTYGTLPTPTYTGHIFNGWYTAASGGTKITADSAVSITSNQTLYAHWTIITYRVSYDANGGTGGPSSQTKEYGITLTLSSSKPSKSYRIQYNANGGSVSSASKSVACTLAKWNSSKDGKGSSYYSGGSYTANADVTLYAQWTNPTAGTLATPSRSGYVFDGWYTGVSGGNKITSSTTVTGNLTVYAHWSLPDPYNMGDETYSFVNFGDSDSKGGHCFGMSVTSAGYHNKYLDIADIGGNANTSLYSFSKTAKVKRPICYYQQIQGSFSKKAIVAGGSAYLHDRTNITSDWQQVVSYVRNHEYDDTGRLQIGIRGPEGGHAINFLRYKNVNGQDRIYAYDNNFPNQETYFYRNSSGNVVQTPQSSLSYISCITLRDTKIYFEVTKKYNKTRAVYMSKDAAAVQGYTYSVMDGDISEEEYVMYEIPEDEDQVIIIPCKDNASFTYMDEEYSFGEKAAGKGGELTLATMELGAVTSEAAFRIIDIDMEFGEPDLILPSALTKIEESAFEQIKATVVYIPDTCASIGAYAFSSSCIEQIRIPEGCAIADTAFEGCGAVQIFGKAGSPAEVFCAEHENCTFIEERQQ